MQMPESGASPPQKVCAAWLLAAWHVVETGVTSQSASV
jgi:hypothetical protein